jgi:hypothetical protein
MMILIAPAPSAPMPKFYINFRSGDHNAKDDEGIELPGLEEARELALASAREILADNVKANAKNPLLGVIITDESGQELMIISAKDVLPELLK